MTYIGRVITVFRQKARGVVFAFIAFFKKTRFGKWHLSVKRQRSQFVSNAGPGVVSELLFWKSPKTHQGHLHATDKSG